MRDGVEIERKFLVRKEGLPPLVGGERITQAYLGFEPVVRARVQGPRGYLTVKGKGLAVRREAELEISAEDARGLMDFRPEGTVVIQKTRYQVRFDEDLWEIDVFEGVLSGLILAEIELGEECQAVVLPPWAGEEVTGNPSYANSNLARHGLPR